MTTQSSTTPLFIDSPAMRDAGRDVLSLALMDARNHTLHVMAQFEPALSVPGFAMPTPGELPPPVWTGGHVGWFQEWWIARNLQRHLGPMADPTALRLASIELHSDVWWRSALQQSPVDSSVDLSFISGRSPDLATTKAYLLESLEATLELLEKAPDTDTALYFYRLALFHEDQQGERLINLAQILGVALDLPMPGPVAARDPILAPAVRWKMGGGNEAGFTFDNERPAYEVSVPEFEIDAQAVSWAQFVEFVDDSGYDRPELWHPDGWAWLQGKTAGEGRRGPRYVDQIGVASGAVMQTRFGKPMRMLGGQPATHVTWWEADAWCRWAGRRLPAEVEWEVAAHTAIRRGWRWGDVWEWTGTTFRGYPGFKPGPWRDYSEPFFGTHKVLRGGSFATRARLKSPKFRGFGLPGSDEIFCGFRSCTL